ncbi:Eukaryotic translation initiation factor 3 subunit C [Leucoagaricus sp. SymC.cos]|nr:Eukaryotic translation initiation factor 3 subunit C [Leucoagaricus sp. SymC.cos]
MSRALVDAIKANDPTQHRLSRGDSRSEPPHCLQSGRRSVAERHVTSQRAKTPVASKSLSRPPSRHSDVHIRNANKQFEIGDSVRIDSLALEGVLRYMGEIEGKNGLWAGVELGGQFAGKGKNNGSVNGIRYFSCSENCGVFVATSKLSPGRSNQPAAPRPSSVASSRSGRITPSFSDRNTPSLSTSRMPSLSLSNGRITPSLSNAKTTPGITPSAKSTYLSKTTPGQKGDAKKLPEKITPGSRAAKYVNMTAKQLSSRKEHTRSPVRQIGEYTTSIPSSPSPISRTLSSPSRPPGSPFSTPKPSLNGRISKIGPSISSTRGRSVQNTPRGRIPSAVAMPPPASPVSAMSRSASLGGKSGLEELTLSSLELQGRALQERIALLTCETTDGIPDRPESTGSSQLNATDDRILVLQARIEALETENERLLSEKAKTEADNQFSLSRKLEEERKKAADDKAQLLKDKDDLRRTHETMLADLEDLRCTSQAGQRRVEELEQRLAQQLDDSQRTVETLNAELSEVKTVRQKLERDNQALQEAKAELQIQAEELGLQVDELRLAGQETIALYEERLSVADGQRYDLENRISTLERAAMTQETESVSQDNHRPAAEIDNEALRDQVIYLQKKLAAMEDLVEDTRLVSEKEEAALRERMKKLKEKEESMKLELSEGRREVERMAKAEAGARNRVEEIEEALREGQVALENARAEIETLRAELSYLQNTEGLQRDITRSEQSVREDHHNGLEAENLRNILILLNQNDELLAQIASLTNASELEKKKPNGDYKFSSGTPSKAELTTSREEITGLKHIVQELQKEHLLATQKIKVLESENEILKSETKLLQSEAEHLRQEVQILENNLDVSAASESPEADASPSTDNAEVVQRSFREQKARYELDCEDLRKRLAEIETKHARITHDLNKEISELEALVEAKIYREDELEQEVERLKEKLSKMKKATKSNGETNSLRHQASLTSVKNTEDMIQSTNENLCEICERPGHDIFTCDLLKEEAPKSLIKLSNSDDHALSHAFQPQPDPALLNTSLPKASGIADDTAQVNVVAQSYRDNPRAFTSEENELSDESNDNPDSSSGKRRDRRLREAKVEGAYLWAILKRYILRPEIAGGCLGLVNLGLLGGLGRTLYIKPVLRKDPTFILSAVAATLGLLTIEGLAAEKCGRTPRECAKEREAKEEGAYLYRKTHEIMLKPGVLGGFVGLANTTILGALGYLAYTHWDQPRWDRKTVSSVTIGLIALFSAGGIISTPIMSRFFRQAGDSDSDTEESEDELMSSGDEAPPPPKPATAMSRFLRTEGSDSSSESSDEESESDESDVPQRRRPGLPLRDESDEEESDDEDKPTARILSAQERRLAEMEATGKVIDNGLKNDDWAAILIEFDKLARMVQRQQNVSEPVPSFYINTLLSLDTSVKGVLADKDAKKKLTTTKARALTAMKQKIKKTLKEYEAEVTKYQTDPEAFEQEYQSTLALIAPTTQATAPAPARSIVRQEDDEEFATVGKGGRVMQFTSEGVLKNLQAVQEARGKKNTDRAEQIRILEKLLEVAATTYQRIRVLLALVSSRFDFTSSASSHMPPELWLSAQREVDQLVSIVATDTSYSVQEFVDDYDELAERIPQTEGGVVRIRGSIISFIDRLDDEFTRSLQHIDPHGTEYVERLKDEKVLYCTICRAQAFYERTKQDEPLSRVIMRRLEHIYSKPNAVVQALESAADLSEIKPSKVLSLLGSSSALVHALCVYLYKSGNSLLRTRAMLSHIYHHALHNDFFTARDMLLMSHLQESIHSADVATQILYNRTVVQLGLCAFRSGLIKEAQAILQEIFTTQRVKELLAQGVHQQRYQILSPEQEKAEKQRMLPFHMHINTELLEAAFLVSSMLVEIPLLASIDSEEQKRKAISKPFRRLLDFADRQVFTGPPESTRDHIMQASKALQDGDWEKCRDLVQSIKIWSLMPEAAAVKEMLAKRIQEQGLRTYLFTYAPHYSSLSLSLLSRTFSLSLRTVTSIVSKMIWNEELAASLDQSSGVIVFHRIELSRPQQLAQVIADKLGNMVEQNEKALDSKFGSSGGWSERVDGVKGEKRGEQIQERRGRGERTRGARGGARGGRGARFAQGLGNQMPGQIAQRSG